METENTLTKKKSFFNKAFTSVAFHAVTITVLGSFALHAEWLDATHDFLYKDLGGFGGVGLEMAYEGIVEPAFDWTVNAASELIA